MKVGFIPAALDEVTNQLREQQCVRYQNNSLQQPLYFCYQLFFFCHSRSLHTPIQLSESVLRLADKA